MWQRDGYRVKLIFLRLSRVEIAIAWVAARVAQGGHAVSEEILRRRFETGWFNFEYLYKPLVDSWMLYDNSAEAPQLLEKGGTP